MQPLFSARRFGLRLAAPNTGLTVLLFGFRRQRFRLRVPSPCRWFPAFWAFPSCGSHLLVAMCVPVPATFCWRTFPILYYFSALTFFWYCSFYALFELSLNMPHLPATPSFLPLAYDLLWFICRISAGVTARFAGRKRLAFGLFLLLALGARLHVPATFTALLRTYVNHRTTRLVLRCRTTTYLPSCPALRLRPHRLAAAVRGCVLLAYGARRGGHAAAGLPQARASRISCCSAAAGSAPFLRLRGFCHLPSTPVFLGSGGSFSARADGCWRLGSVLVTHCIASLP